MKYTLVMERVGDYEELEFDSRYEALEEAKSRWEHLTSYERGKHSKFEVIADDLYLIADFIHQFTIRDRESWTIIEERPTLMEAYIELDWFEQKDRRDGVFEPNFYQIVRTGIVYDHVYMIHDKRCKEWTFYGTLPELVEVWGIEIEHYINEDSYIEISNAISEMDCGLELERVWF